MTPEFAAFLGQFGLPLTILVVLVVSGTRGTWVWGRELANERAEKDLARKKEAEWKTIAFKALGLGEAVVGGAEKNADG